MEINILMSELSSTIKKDDLLKWLGSEGDMPYVPNREKLALPSVAEVVEAAKAVSYR
jgi:hypothetical protein